MQLVKSLPDRLSELAEERRRLEDDLRAVRIATGRLLLEVRLDDEQTLAAAAQLLGLSRQTVHCLLRDAEEGQS